MIKYDIVAKVGEYQKDGQTKAKFKNVGVYMEKDGKPFLLLDRTFNPAGMPNPDNKESVLLSLYEPKNRSGSANNAHTDKPEELDDNVPF